MPERELEAFLDAVTRDPRLDEAERQRIAHELRDHLDERFHELIAEGTDRSAAIGTTLDELGDPRTLVAAFKLSDRREYRRHFIMKTMVATAAAVGLTASLLMLTGIPSRGQEGLADTAHPQADTATEARHAALDQASVAPDESPTAPEAMALPGNVAAFSFDQDLYFHASSAATLARDDATTIPALTAYGLRFSRDVPHNVRLDRGLWNPASDPYKVQVPEGVNLDELSATAPRDANADEADVPRPLYAVLATVSTRVRGTFKVRVTLFDADETPLGQAEARVLSNHWVFATTAAAAHDHTLQSHLLVFDDVPIDAGRIAHVRADIIEEAVELPELPEPGQANAGGLAEGDAGERGFTLDHAVFSRQTEMDVLANAIADLNRSIDGHRAVFEQVLADPTLATSKDRARLRWKLYSLQLLRAELESKYSAYALSC